MKDLLDIDPKNIDLERRIAWNSAFVVAIIVTLVQVVSIFFLDSSADFYWIRFSRVLHAITAFVVLICLIRYRNKWKIRTLSGVFVALIFPFFGFSWLVQVFRANSGMPWVPLDNYILVFFTVTALGSPTTRAPWILLFGFGMEALILWHYLDIPNRPNAVLGHQAYNLLVAFFVSWALLVYRTRDRNYIRHLSARRARLEVAEGIAKVFLSLRDLSNTPLQTLTAGISVMKAEVDSGSKNEQVVEVMDRALVRITSMNQVLGRLESLISWDKKIMQMEEIQAWIDDLEVHESKEEPSKS